MFDWRVRAPGQAGVSYTCTGRPLQPPTLAVSESSQSARDTSTVRTPVWHLDTVTSLHHSPHLHQVLGGGQPGDRRGTQSTDRQTDTLTISPAETSLSEIYILKLLQNTHQTFLEWSVRTSLGHSWWVEILCAVYNIVTRSILIH